MKTSIELNWINGYKWCMFHIYGLSKDHRFPQQFSTSPCPPLSWSSCPKTQTPPMAVSTWRGFLSNEESIGLKSCQFWSYFLRLSPQIDWLYFILADSHLYPKKKSLIDWGCLLLYASLMEILSISSRSTCSSTLKHSWWWVSQYHAKVDPVTCKANPGTLVSPALIS